MIKTEFQFNGQTRLVLSPSNEEDRQLLQLAFNGREVKTIRPTQDGGVILEMAKSEEKQS